MAEAEQWLNDLSPEECFGQMASWCHEMVRHYLDLKRAHEGGGCACGCRQSSPELAAHYLRLAGQWQRRRLDFESRLAECRREAQPHERRREG